MRHLADTQVAVTDHGAVAIILGTHAYHEVVRTNLHLWIGRLVLQHRFAVDLHIHFSIHQFQVDGIGGRIHRRALDIFLLGPRLGKADLPLAPGVGAKSDSIPIRELLECARPLALWFSRENRAKPKGGLADASSDTPRPGAPTGAFPRRTDRPFATDFPLATWRRRPFTQRVINRANA